MKEELEEARREFATMESRKNQEIKDLRQQINRDADQARKREAKLMERVEERKKEMQAVQAALMTAQSEAKKLSAERDTLKTTVQELEETLEHEREFWETELSEKVTEIEALQGKLDAANAKLAELALQTAELEHTCQRLRKEVQDETARCQDTLVQLSKLQQTMGNLQADLSTWAMDAHAVKKGRPADLDFQGAAYSNGEPPEDVSNAVVEANHIDLLLLLQIAGGNFAGLYAISDDRQKLAQNPSSSGNASPLEAEAELELVESAHSTMDEKESPTPGVFGRRKSTAPMLQQLSEAHLRIQELEESLETLQNASVESIARVQTVWVALLPPPHALVSSFSNADNTATPLPGLQTQFLTGTSIIANAMNSNTHTGRQMTCFWHLRSGERNASLSLRDWRKRRLKFRIPARKTSNR